jgi:hypothetical protein
VYGNRRATRIRAAAIGLALLLGLSLGGCHSGPQLFSRRDSDRRAEQERLADRNPGKFIHRKKVRPEAEYLRDEPPDKLADNDTRLKNAPKNSSSRRATDSVNREVANRTQDDRSERTQRTLHEQAADRWAESPLKDSLTRTQDDSHSLTARKIIQRPTRDLLDEDPFRDSVLGPTAASPTQTRVAPVNFNDDQFEENLAALQREAEEFERRGRPAVPSQKSAVPKAAANKPEPGPKVARSSKTKFLDDFDAPTATDGTATDSTESDLADDLLLSNDIELERPTSQATVVNSAPTIAGQPVLDRRQQAQQRLNDWQRELKQKESLSAIRSEPIAPKPTAQSSSNASTSPPAARGHLSETSLDEFISPQKSQGAVLNGELIIDTQSVPTRFQRGSGISIPPQSASGKVNRNSRSSLDVAPSDAQSRPRSADQITLQSLPDGGNPSSLTTAEFEVSRASIEPRTLPPLELGTENLSGPQLPSASADESAPGSLAGLSPLPDDDSEFESSAPVFDESTAGTKSWKRALVVLTAMISAVLIGFRVRRRFESTVQPVAISQPTPRADSESNLAHR